MRLAAWSPSLLRELSRELELAIGFFVQSPLLFRSPYREMFLRFYLLAGMDSLGGVALRAAMIGTAIVGYVANVMAADATIAIQLIQTLVIREVAPLFAALIVMAQAGIQVTSQFVRLRERGEIAGLRILGVSPFEFLVLPCMAGMMLATLILCLYFAILSAGGGILVSSIFADVSVIQLGEYFLATLSPADLLMALFKSLLFGLAIGAATCYHGLVVDWVGQNVTRPVARSAMQSLFLISLIQAVLSYLQHGVVFFGILQ